MSDEGQTKLKSRISVITATELNPDRLDWLEELSSQLAGYDEIEHILVLDGADGSNLRPGHVQGRVSLLPLAEKVGLAEARNAGLSLATGEYVICVDDDDLISAEGLLKVRDWLDASPTFGWAAGKVVIIDEQGNQDTIWDQPANVGLYRQGRLMNTWISVDDNYPLLHSTILARTELVRSIGGWGAKAPGDDLHFMLGVTGKSNGSVQEHVVAQCRIHDGNAMYSQGYDGAENHVRVRGMGVLNALRTRTGSAYRHN